MKRVYLLMSLLLLTSISFAIPARRGIWKTIKLADGTEVRATLKGDETSHYYMDAEGNVYVQYDDNTYILTNSDTIAARMTAKRKSAPLRRTQRQASKVADIGKSYTGKKKGLIILAQFSDKTFEDGHDNSYYNSVANEVGFTNDEGYAGSVKDYFLAQSNGKFELDFDIAGPYTLPKSYSYYGKNNRAGNDAYIGEMIASACTMADADVNFSEYDWDGDGEVEQVFVVYAGYGENSSYDKTTVWPCKWELSSSDYNKSLKLDNTKIDVFACSCEMEEISDNDAPKVSGIGTICHEFSHCLGFPDVYDTGDGNNFGMDTWDLMDYGSYNGNGFKPCGYSSYEKWVAGWITPIELKADTVVSNMKALSDGGEAYVIYNGNHTDEFYLLENRQQTGWDASLYGNGLLVLHVDYDDDAWYYNTVNNTKGHQRYTIFHADNSARGIKSGITNYKSDLAGDPYPYLENDSLTNNSKPSATLHNYNTDGLHMMNKGITGIARNDDGTVSFTFQAVSRTITSGEEAEEIFHETFDQCNGTGGNDNQWGGMVAMGNFVPDVNGWTSSKKYGGNKCARFGTASVKGTVLSPTFTLNGQATLTLKIAPWNDSNSSVDIYLNDELIDSYSLECKTWNTITADIVGEGDCQLQFIPNGRIFIDDVLISTAASSGIVQTKSNVSRINNNRIYSINGQYLGRDTNSLKSGIYIINGKKYVK